MNLKFTVLGRPVPQGSMKPFTPKGAKFTVLVSDNKALKPWRQQVSETALTLWRDPPSEAPIGIVLDFYFDKPRSVKRERMTVKPDSDKLARSILDSCTGIVFRDDAQVVDIRVRKHYGSPARVEILVGEL